MAFQHFLLVYDLTQHRLVRQETFDDGDAAGAAYAELEAEYRDRRDLEIVLVGADSIETIKRTHAHYFDEASDSLYLAGA